MGGKRFCFGRNGLDRICKGLGAFVSRSWKNGILSDVFVHEYAHIISLKAYLPWSESSTYMEMGGLVEDEEWLKRWGVQSTQSVILMLDSMECFRYILLFGGQKVVQNIGHIKPAIIFGDTVGKLFENDILENRQLDLNEWTTVANKKGFDGERGYNQGYDFGLYLHQKFERPVMTEMAEASAKKWNWSWDNVVEEVTDASMEELYSDWVETNTKRFERTKQKVESKGRVEGLEMSLIQPEWEMTSGDEFEDWQELERSEQEEIMDGETAYQEFPRYSPDGKYLAWFEAGLNVMEIGTQEWGSFWDISRFKRSKNL